ncbi:MAG: PorT family protein [Cyclobacteriaceae bacterium]|nr:PorT family protein [Cyclobacteriaceae bacterium]MCH8515451.1 PorT family protein [Cyclobacteriaceae bacterium]
MKRISGILFIIFVSITTLFAQNDNKTPMPDLPGTIRIDFGLNFNNNFPSEMSNRAWGSRTVNINYIYDKQIGATPFYWAAGIGLGLDRYSFRDAITFSAIDDNPTTIEPFTTLDEFGSIEKSILSTNYLDIPLEIRYHTRPNSPNKGLMFAIGGKVGYLFDSKTKHVYNEFSERKITKQKESFNLNPLRYGLSARVGMKNFHTFFYYGLNPIFQEGLAPEGAENAREFRVGLSLSLF